MPVGSGGLSAPPGGVTLTLQADFSGTAFGGSPTWTDITPWWMSSGVDPGGGPVTIPWGRQDQSSVVESSSTSFTLNNADGRFTPGRSTLVTGGANPYYPNVRRHVRMRLTATDGTTTVTLVDGLVDAWVVTPQTDGPTLAAAELTDVFGRVSASTALRSIYAEEVLADSPTAFYMLDEPAGATAGGNIATAPQPSIAIVTSKHGGTPPAFGAGLAMPSVADVPGVLFSGTSSTVGGSLAFTPTVPTSTSWTLEAWVASSAGSTAVDLLNTFTGGGVQFSMTASTSGITTGYAPRVVSFGTRPVAATLTHVALVVVPGGASQYVNGAFDDLAAFTGNPVMPTQITVGGAGKTAITRFLSGTVLAVALYPTALSDPRIAAHYTAGLTAFAGESTAIRWARLATYRPNLGAATSGTVGTVGSRDLTGMSLGDAFTDTATAEGGVIETHRGTLRLIGRSGNRNPTTTVTLNAANSEVDIPTTWRDDTQGFLNDATVTRANGATQRVTSPASIAADGVSQTSIDANVNSDRDAADMAGWTVVIGTQDELTSPTLTTNLNAKKNAALTLAVCALRTFDVVTLTNLPASAPAATMSLQAQGGQITVGADTFTVTINTTAKPPQILQVKTVADATTALDTGNVIGW